MNCPIFWNYPELLPGVGFGNVFQRVHVHDDNKYDELQSVYLNINKKAYTCMLLVTTCDSLKGLHILASLDFKNVQVIIIIMRIHTH